MIGRRTSNSAYIRPVAPGARYLSWTCSRRAALTQLDLEGHQSTISDAVGAHLVNQYNLDFPGPAQLPEGWISGSGGKLPPGLTASAALNAYGIQQEDPFFHRAYAKDTRPTGSPSQDEKDKTPTGLPRIPGDWARFPYFMTYVAPSPYYLMLPQLQMIVNIKYGLRGDVVPLMYDPKHEALVFSMRRWAEGIEAASPHFYWLHCPSGEVSEFLLPDNSDELDTLMARWEDAEENLTSLLSAVGIRQAPQTPLEPDAKGLEVINRIMERDPGVIEVLENDYFSFKIAPTTEEEEAQLFDPRPLLMEEELAKRFVHEGATDGNGNPDEVKIDLNTLKSWIQIYSKGQGVNIERVSDDFIAPEVVEEPVDRYDEEGRRILEVEERQAP